MFSKASIKMTKGVNEKIETRETVEGKKVNKSREMISALEGRMTISRNLWLKEFVVEALNSNVEVMQGVLSSTMDKLTTMDDVLKAVVLTLKGQIAELKGELTIYRVVLGNRVLAIILKTKVDVTKLKEFKGTRSTRDVDNFLWGMESLSYDAIVGLQMRNEMRSKLELRRSSKSSFIHNMQRRRLGLSCGIIELTKVMTVMDYLIELVLMKTSLSLSSLTRWGTVEEMKKDKLKVATVRFKLSAIKKEDEAELVHDRVLRLGSMIFNFPKEKKDLKQKWLIIVDIDIAG
ncbi:hypothetical protein Gogos_020557 [Gossypium gossypioides]|uniref:Uncharacterized protein n=1 Tax=Gossypium gossypioides TaxID=34282 RepID=A0A7J9CZC7_GOSGO|nr:hypothetical protein [Gossypium gossypioides]